MMEDIIEYTNRNQIPGLILFLDFEKAFDTIEWEFIFKCLEKFGFGNEFIKWINNIFLSICFCQSKWVHIKNKYYGGIRQGCPLLALLFIMCIEMLILAIKQNTNIKGIEITQKNKTSNCSKISQYADDGSLYLKDIGDIINALDEEAAFSSVAGPNLNIDKAEGLWIGSMSDSDQIYGNIKWSQGPIRYLGVYVGTNHISCRKLNWDDKIINYIKNIR